MAMSVGTVGTRDSVVVILDKDHPQDRFKNREDEGISTIEVDCISEAIDRLSDFTTDSWPDVLVVRRGTANMLALMAEVCRTAGVRLVSQREHADAAPSQPL